MTATLGQFALFAGLFTAASAAYWWLIAARAQDGPSTPWVWRLARWATWGMFAAAVIAVAAMEWALITHDFSIRYVAENGGRAVPVYYTAISLWAALEGSLLLWLLVLAGLTVAVMLRAGAQGRELHPWALSVMGWVAVFFFGLAIFAGNAFETISPVPADGPGPNPLLQDHPLMGVHPPLLYVGYAGMTIPFAYAVAALATGRTGGAWVAVTRRWTLLAWTSLTVAIVMGGWWSYEVLGWGGYWAWDPVENASIIPWFVATALLHSMMAQSRRATLRVWNLVLALTTFILVLVGTFITRSGVIQSVHSFTQSPVGPVLLGFIGVVVLFSGALLLWRADRLGPDEGMGGGLSRESVFLGNNLLLVALAFTVLLGTVFPLIAEAVNGARISVGAPYFNRMAVPLALAVVLLMGVGPLVPWGRASPRALTRRLAVPALAGLAVAGGLGLAGVGDVTALLTFGLAVFVLTGVAAEVGRGLASARRATDSGPLRAMGRALTRRRRYYGGLVVHVGVVMAAVAIAASQTYAVEAQQKLEVGDSFSVAGHTVQLEGIDRQRDARKMWVSAEVTLSRGDTELGSYAPALNFYQRSSEAIGTPAVHTTVTGDAYLVLVQVDEDAEWAVISLAVNPLVVWIWISTAVMAAGALIAGWPERRRHRGGPPTADSASEEPAAQPEVAP
ncbi:heme lyase CcmF/NrfE family subunit [Nocardiopsis tropica]|uniref:Heme lyase CcmF/NrfE family subunit n=1 Tax=Nocardiopsis tropica TaxID=109330 RepID=A0ABU7KKK0_9ACTN|nr:heme lyase CcmF/NrfE family subunit [Nocardiopsis umidischolae]MEE2049672.1 heme lyase CcmF/NrfE family subunit [Nocardiopsis umidischolae]